MTNYLGMTNNILTPTAKKTPEKYHTNNKEITQYIDDPSVMSRRQHNNYSDTLKLTNSPCCHARCLLSTPLNKCYTHRIKSNKSGTPNALKVHEACDLGTDYLCFRGRSMFFFSAKPFFVTRNINQIIWFYEHNSSNLKH